MPSVVEIVVRAKNEASGAIKNLAGEFGELGGTVGRVLAGIGPMAAGIAGIATAGGAVVAFGKQLAETAVELERLSARTGVSTDSLQVFQTIVREGGGDSDALTTALTRLNKSIGEGNPLLAKLGITTRDTKEAFLQLVGIFSRSNDQAAVTAASFKLMGRGIGELLPDVKRLATEFDSTQTRMSASGELMTSSLLEKGKELHGGFIELGRDWKVVWNEMEGVAAPAADAIVRSIAEIVAASQHADSSAGLGFLADIAFHLSAASKNADSAKVGINYLTNAAAETNAELVALINKRDAVLEIPSALANVDSAIARRAATLAGLREKLDALMAEQPKIGPVWEGPDSTAQLRDAIAKDTQAASERSRAKAIADIRAELGMTQAQAEQTYAALQKIEFYEKRDSMLKKLGVTYGPMPTQDTLDQNALAEQNAKDAAIAQKKYKGTGEDAITEMPRTLQSSLAEWKKALDEMTSTAQVASDTIGASFYGMQSGFQNAFAGILNQTQTLSQAVVGIIGSMVSQVEAELARLAAAKFFQFLISAFTVGTGVAQAAGGSGVAQTGNVVPFVQPTTGPGPANVRTGGAAAATQIVLNVNAIDSRSVQDAFKGIDGVFAIANRRAAASQGF